MSIKFFNTWEEAEKWMDESGTAPCIYTERRGNGEWSEGEPITAPLDILKFREDDGYAVFATLEDYKDYLFDPFRNDFDSLSTEELEAVKKERGEKAAEAERLLAKYPAGFVFEDFDGNLDVETSRYSMSRRDGDGTQYAIGARE